MINYLILYLFFILCGRFYYFIICIIYIVYMGNRDYTIIPLVGNIFFYYYYKKLIDVWDII